MELNGSEVRSADQIAKLLRLLSRAAEGRIVEVWQNLQWIDGKASWVSECNDKTPRLL